MPPMKDTATNTAQSTNPIAMTGALTDDETARGALACMRQMEPATRICVAHVNAATARDPKTPGRPFGSAFFWNGMRSGIEVRRAQDDQIDGQIDVGLYHRKTNDGWHHKPVALQVGFDGLAGPIAFDMQSMTDVPDLQTGTPLSSRIRQLLKMGAQNVNELAEELDEKPDIVRTTLHRMKDTVRLSSAGGKGQTTTWGLVVEHNA